MLAVRFFLLAFLLTFLTATSSWAAAVRTDGSLHCGGLTRLFNYYAPDNLPQGRPVVVVLHGGGQHKDAILNSPGVAPTEEWLPIADENQLLLIAPNGVNATTGSPAGTSQSWNDGRADNFTTSTADDIGFMHALLHWAETLYKVDRQRIYFTGSSNGGLLCYRVAREMSHRVAAIAAFIANKPAQDIPGNPEFPIPVFICNGQGETQFMPWAGGIVSGNPNAGTVLSAVATRDYWKNFNQCGPATSEAFPNINTADDSTASRLLHTGGREGAEVELIVVLSGGHVVPSVAHGYNQAVLTAQGLGIQNRDVEGARLAWTFLARQSLGTSRGLSYTEWLASLCRTNSEDNLLAYATGGIQPRLVGSDLVYQIRSEMLGATVVAQASATLQFWQDILTTPTRVANPDGTTTVTIREPAPSPLRRFYRLKAISAP
jgi:polyhydroxybutyrate depolymerase